jgi:hypothetical protein
MFYKIDVSKKKRDVSKTARARETVRTYCFMFYKIDGLITLGSVDSTVVF